MGWLTAAITILQLLPTLFNSAREIVRALDADDVPGIGGDKKGYAMNMISTSLDAVDDLIEGDEVMDPKVKATALNICSGLIDGQVAFDKSVKEHQATP